MVKVLQLHGKLARICDKMRSAFLCTAIWVPVLVSAGYRSNNLETLACSILGVYRENGKVHGGYHIVFWASIGRIERTMAATI